MIDVFRPGQPTITLKSGDVLDGGDVLPSFTTNVTAIFAVLDEAI